MNKEMNDLFKEALKDDYFKTKIKQAFEEKIINNIKFESDSFINEYIKELFDNEFKLELEKVKKEQKENFKNLINKAMKDSFITLSKRIEFKVNDWDIRKLIKDSINLKEENDE